MSHLVSSPAMKAYFFVFMFKQIFGTSGLATGYLQNKEGAIGVTLANGNGMADGKLSTVKVVEPFFREKTK
jgi:hypothetical protein